MSAERRVEDAAAALGVAMPAGSAARLVQIGALIARWNPRIRLVGPNDLDTIVDEHVIDALGFARTLQRLDALGDPGANAVSGHWYDIGSGAGLPGLPLAVLFPERRFELVEPIAKKSAFQTRAAVELGLDNARIHALRDDQLPRGAARAALSRATFAPDVWYARAASLVGPGGLVIVALGSGDAPALREAAMLVDEYRLPSGAQRTNLALGVPA